MADQHSTRVKRKPPPSFPYSSRYPVPDPSDPFAPLAALRERAHSSNVALVTPPDNPYTSNPRIASPDVTTESGHSHYILHPDAQPSDYSHSTTSNHYTPKNGDVRTTPSRPWYHLTSGYFSEAAKPLRPPRAKGRPGRESASYFSDVDITSDVIRQQELPRQPHHPNLARSGAEPQRRQIDVSAQNRGSEYHYRRRSKSVFVLPSSTPAANTVSPNISSPPRADPSRQYTYDDRQSHGYRFNEYELEFDQSQDRPQASTKRHTSTRSRASTNSDRSKRPTPPMTPDDTLSSTSVSPRDRSTARSTSSSPPRAREIPQSQTKTHAPSKHRPSNIRVVRDPLPNVTPIQDTPASIHSSDFPLLLPPSPPSIPPSPTPVSSPAPNNMQPHAHVTHATHAPMPHTESEPETHPSPEPMKRRRVTSIDSMRRRLRKSPATVTGIRGKMISNPTPVVSSPGRKPSFASDSSVSVGHGNEVSSVSTSAARGGRLAVTQPSQRLRPEEEVRSDTKPPQQILLPKPKKSLSHVDLHLKPLPNLSQQGVSMVGPSGNISTASAIGNISLLRPPEMRAATRDDDLSAPSDQEVLVPPPRMSSIPAAARAETQHFRAWGRHVTRTPAQAPRKTVFIARQESYESEVEDESTFTALIALRELLSPYPLPSALDNLHTRHAEPESEEREQEQEQEQEQESGQEQDYVMTAERSPDVIEDYLVEPDPSPPQTPAKPALRYSPVRVRAESPARFEKHVAVQRRSPSPVEVLTQHASSVERFLATHQRSESPPAMPRPSPPQYRSDSPVPKRVYGPPPRSQSPIPVETQTRRRSESPVQVQAPKRAYGPQPRSQSPIPVETQTQAIQRRPESPVQVQRPAAGPIQRRSESPVYPTRPPATQRRSESPVHPLAQRPASIQRPESPVRPTPTRVNSADQVSRVAVAVKRSESPIPSRVARRAESPPRSRSESPVPPRVASAPRRAESPAQIAEASRAAQKRSTSPVEPLRRPSPIPRKSGPSAGSAERPPAPIHKRSDSPVEVQAPVATRQMVSRRRATSPEHREPPRRVEQPSTSRSVPIPSTRRVEAPGPLPLSPPVPYKDVSLSPLPVSPPPFRALSPPPRAMSPVPPDFDSPLPPAAFRAPSPVPQPQRHPSAERKQAPKREGSKEEKSDYLPVAQLRSQPQMASKTQSGSVSSRRKPSAHSETQSVQSRARSATVTSETSTVVARITEDKLRDEIVLEEEIPATPAKDIFFSSPVARPRRQRTVPSTPALALSSPVPTSRSHPYPPKKAESYSHSSRSKVSGRTQTKSPTDFDGNALVSREQLARAASMTVIAQNGLRVPFGDLFKDRKAIVIFIRHFWCAMDQDYMYSIAKNVDSAALRRAGTELVLIGNGASGMIKSYRHIFRTPFSMYTDPGLRIYSTLGMTKRTNDPGPEFEKGEYVRHGLVGGIAMVVRNALKVGMPVWEKGGESSQLGGEFIFGPGMSCLYAHRMKYTRDHAPILGVLAASGLQIYTTAHQEDSQSTLTIDDEDQWMRDRDKSLDRRTAERERRRRGERPVVREESGWNEDDVVAPDGASDSGSASVSGSWELSPRRDARSPDPSERAERTDRTERTESERVRSGSTPTRARRTGTRPSRKFRHVSNPDHGDDYHPYAQEKEKEDGEIWRSGSTNALYREGRYGRNDEAYMLTHDALAYSFGASR